ERQLWQLFERHRGETGVGTQLHGDRLDPGSDGGPRRLSTPTLTETEQIRLFDSRFPIPDSRFPIPDSRFPNV
ncbi:hypothetical protein, partial [Xanthomonas campestris]|uniref:hypothetical protein n=1 Tax=Xanthomonas campestris TaxID=339 RepID=UPI001C6F2E3D